MSPRFAHGRRPRKSSGTQDAVSGRVAVASRRISRWAAGGCRWADPARCCVLALALQLAAPRAARAQGAQAARVDEPVKPQLTIYGFTQLDAGYDFGRIDPRYYDRLRTSALPASEDQYGTDGNAYFSVRQTRIGTKSVLPTPAGTLSTTVEFDLVGRGADAGQTTPYLRLFYGQLGAIGAGQYWSPFVDPEVSPEIFESYRPPGQPFTRSPQIRWMPLRGPHTRLTFALEKPGARADGGPYANDITERKVTPRFPAPEVTAAVWRGGAWGHVQLAGLWRRMRWDDPACGEQDLSGNAYGYGLNLTSRLRFGRHTARVQYLVGRGIENYINDSTPDVGLEPNPGDPHRPVVGVALPVWSFTGYWESVAGPVTLIGGYGRQRIDNSAGQMPTAYHAGSYATATAAMTPAPGFTLTAEYQWGRRENAFDGWAFDDHRIQFSARFRFSTTVGK